MPSPEKEIVMAVSNPTPEEMARMHVNGDIARRILALDIRAAVEARQEWCAKVAEGEPWGAGDLAAAIRRGPDGS